MYVNINKFKAILKFSSHIGFWSSNDKDSYQKVIHGCLEVY